MYFRISSFALLALVTFCLPYNIHADESAFDPSVAGVQDAVLTINSDSTLHLTVEPLFGIRYGQMGEHLFYQDRGEYKKLSYLEWEEKPLWYGGGKLSANYRRISGTLILTGAIPGRTGSMYDSDWVNLNDMKTDYSISENSVNSDIHTGVEVSYTFNPSGQTTIVPFTGFDFEYISFSAKNGHGWYADEDTINEYNQKYGYPLVNQSYSYDSSQAVYFPEGSLYGVDYTRFTYTLWLGCTVSFTPIDRLTLYVCPAFSPYMWVQAVDHHHGQDGGTYYMDQTNEWLAAVKATITAEYRINHIYSLVLSCSGGKSSIIRGYTYTSASENSGYSRLENYEGGTSYQYVDASLGLLIHLF